MKIPLGFGLAGSINVGIEIGSSKVCVAVGERRPDGSLRILGVGREPSRGVRQGSIVDFNMARECVRKAVREAGEKSDVVISSVRLAVNGAHVGGFNHRSVIDLPARRGVITGHDCELVRAQARAAALPSQHMFLHAFLQNYYLDGRARVPDLVGTRARRLEAVFHIVHGLSPRIQPAVRCVKELGIDVEEVAFSPIAAAQAVLAQSHKDEGALLIDLGAGTTGYVLYLDGEIRQSGALAAGGDFISSDIACFHHIPIALAEKLKIEEGSASLGDHEPGETLSIESGPGSGAIQIEREILNTIIYLRMRETLELLKGRLAGEPDLNSLGAGIFLTGGTSLLARIGPLAREIFEMPVHLTHELTARDVESEFINPQYSAALGLLLADPP